MSFESPAPERNSRLRAALQWLVLGAVGLVALALAAAHLPVEVKRIGLFPLAWGALAGALLGWAARVTALAGGADSAEAESPAPGRAWLVASFLLVAAGQALVAFESHRLWAAPQRQHLRDSPLLQIHHSLERDAGASDEAGRQFQRVVERAVDELYASVHFTTWLQRRVGPFSWPAWAAAAFWVGELLAGSALGAWVAGRVVRPKAVAVAGTEVRNGQED